MRLDHSFSETDLGPLYKETIYGRWPVEPFNTLTTLFFLLLVLYWWFKIKPHYKEHLLISLTLPLIAIGFVGGFLYHSFRDYAFWLYLDWVPIVISANIAAIYFWRTYLTSWWKSLVFTYAPLVLSLMFQKVFIQGTSFLSLSYFILIVSVLVPVVFYIYRKPLKNTVYLGFAIFSIALALTSRILDRNEMLDWLPMGSHFLWHTFGALTCHFFINYIYLEKPQLKNRR